MNPNNFLRIRNRNAVSMRFFDFFLWRCTMKKFLLILFTALLLCACLPVSSTEPAPPVFGWVKLEENKIRQGEDLEVIIVYGLQDYCRDWKDLNIESTVSATLQMSSYVYDKGGENRERYAKKILHTMNDEQFRAKHDRSPEKDYYGITETVTIPHDWFAGDQGSISWTLKCELYTVDKEINEEYTETPAGGFSLYYIKQGKNILLFDNYYDYKNYNQTLEETKHKLCIAIAATAVAIPVAVFAIRWGVKKKKQKNAGQS